MPTHDRAGDRGEAARPRAASERTTPNEQVRRWLADYVGRQRQAAEAVQVMRELQGRLDVGRASKPSIDRWLERVRERQNTTGTRLPASEILRHLHAGRR